MLKNSYKRYCIVAPVAEGQRLSPAMRYVYDSIGGGIYHHQLDRLFKSRYKGRLCDTVLKLINMGLIVKI